MSHFERKVWFFSPIFLLKCLRGRETENRGNVCTSYLEGEEIAGIAGKWRTVANDRLDKGRVTQREDQKIGNRKYEVRNRRWLSVRARRGIALRQPGNEKKAAGDTLPIVERAEQTLCDITRCFPRNFNNKDKPEGKSFFKVCRGTVAQTGAIKYSNTRVYVWTCF